jgi:phage terminase large subunit-like protein
MSSQLPNFLTKHLNIFVESSTAWIPEDVLQRTNVPFNLSRFEGMDVYIGLDLSSTRDLTSIVLLFFDPDENMFYAEPLFFIAKNPERRLRQGGIDLRPWIRSGLIIECQTETIDYNLLFEWFENLDKRFNIVAVGFDPYSSDLLVPRLNEVGINTVRFDQTARNFNFPLKYLEKLIYDRGISLGGNPVLLWNIRNVVLYSDGNGNIKILKNKSRDAVDGAVALGEALAMYLSVNLDSQKMNLSAYLERN